MAVSDAERYKGVRGWLLFLCISLTILDPAAMVLGVFTSLQMPQSNFDRYPEMLRFLMISGVCRLALAVFSIYSGAALWGAVPGAPDTAKRYLQAAAIYSVFSLLLPRLAGLSDELYREMTGAALVSSVASLCYVAAWYSYLAKSKRIKETYQIND